MFKKSIGFINYFLLFSIGIIWGSQFVLNNIALRSMDAITISAGRALIGFLSLALYVFFRKEKGSTILLMKSTRVLSLCFSIAMFETVIPLFLIAFGLGRINGGVAAVLMGTVPIFTIFTSTIVARKWNINITMILSIFIGFSGVFILAIPNMQASNVSSLIGQISILASSLSFAISLTLMKLLPEGSPAKIMRNILGIATVPLIILAAVFGKPVEYSYFLSSMLALFFLGVFCTGLVYVMFIILIQRTTPTFASLTNYLIPLIGMVAGNFFMSEKITGYEISALFCVLFALWLANAKMRKPSLI